MAFCPCHDDGKTQGRRSLHVSEKDEKVLLNCFAGCSYEAIKTALGLGSARMKDVNISEIYDYIDESGNLLFQVCRMVPKTFRQRRPDGKGGWIWNLKDTRRVLYRLPKVLEALGRGETIYICEGEKDVHSLEKIGLVATTNPGGAGKWLEEYNMFFPAKSQVVILPDNDRPGHDHANKIAEQLFKRGVKVKVLELPDLPPKGDVSDWLASGGTKEELLRLAAEAPEWRQKDDGWPEPEPISISLLPVEKLPEEIIPGPFRPWVTDVAHRMQCPPDFIAVAVMIMAGSVIGAGCGIRPKKYDDWLVVPNLWGGIVARPGMLKTPALMEALKPLAALEARARKEYEAAMKEYEADKELYKAQKEALKSKMVEAAKNKKKGEALSIAELRQQYLDLKEPEPPVWRRYKTNDSTIERMGELLSENPRGILLFRDELIGLLASWDREGRETDRAFYLEAWNGHGSHTTDRIGRGTVHVDNLCVSILGGIQPAKLMAYLYEAMSELENDGLMQRMQLLVYPDEPEDWELVDRYPDKKARELAFRVIERLDRMDFTAYGARLDEGERIPYLRFTDGAQGLFNEWLTELERVKLRRDDPPALLEHLSKYRSLMPSLALIIHLIDVAAGKTEGNVSLKAAEMAAAWCDYLESHSRRIYALVGDVGQRAAAELAKKIKAGALEDGFTVRDIYRKQWHLLNKKEVVQEACAELVEACWLKQVAIEIPGRQPKIAYRINPKIFSLNVPLEGLS